MKAQEVKTIAKDLTELRDSRKQLASSMIETAQGAAAPQKLFREGNKSKLMSIGMAVLLFPEPTPISAIVGAGMMATGAIQQGIKRRSIFAEDIPKTLQKTFKELRQTRNNFRL